MPADGTGVDVALGSGATTVVTVYVRDPVMEDEPSNSLSQRYTLTLIRSAGNTLGNFVMEDLEVAVNGAVIYPPSGSGSGLLNGSAETDTMELDADGKGTATIQVTMGSLKY